MSESISVTSARTEDLNADTRASIIQVCIAAYHEDDFNHLFTHYITAGGIHVLAYRAQELIGHAVVTERWLQPEGLPMLRTAYLDAVATLPTYQGQGVGSIYMRHLATLLSDFEIACLETDRVSFYARLGWEEWRGALAGRRATELLPTPDQKGIMILRLARTPPLDVDRSLTIEYDGRIW
ncbi:MAG: GNAT family N-acetyltransferase [Roseiflexaceae bacterium]